MQFIRDGVAPIHASSEDVKEEGHRSLRRIRHADSECEAIHRTACFEGDVNGSDSLRLRMEKSLVPYGKSSSVISHRATAFPVPASASCIAYQIRASITTTQS